MSSPYNLTGVYTVLTAVANFVSFTIFKLRRVQTRLIEMYRNAAFLNLHDPENQEIIVATSPLSCPKSSPRALQGLRLVDYRCLGFPVP